MTLAVPDRRLALKLRHRDAILDAARALIDERGGPSFSVDDLAAKADVARRTVFNHFAGMDDVLLTVCADVLAIIVDDFLTTVSEIPVGDGTPSSMFDELETAIRASHLPDAIVALLRILGGPDTSTARAFDLSEAAFARVGDRLLAEVERRNPGVDPLDAELLVSSLIHGIAVLAEHWIRTTGGRLDPASLAEWSALLDRLLVRIRSGYAPD